MIINLTPHIINVFSEDQFVNLEQANPTTWVADGVVGQAVAEYPSKGVARIAPITTDDDSIEGIPVVKTTYGEAVGIPEGIGPDDILIVSLPMQSMAKESGHPLAAQMVSPYKVVRSRQNGSLVLGCMGFTR